jgi:hypothetical protein
MMPCSCRSGVCRFSMDDGAEVGELKELNIKTTA